MEEIGEEFHLTRERIRQIFNSVLSKEPFFYEDRYKYWFEKYNMSKDAFCYIFDEVESTYYYLKITCEWGELDIEKMEFDENIDDELLSKVNQYFLKDLVDIDGELVPKTRRAIVTTILKNRHKEEPVALDIFSAEYEQICEENGLKDFTFLDKAKNTFENYISRPNMSDVLESYGNKYRYYDINLYDIPSLISQLDFQPYMGCVISSLKIFENHKDLMEEYNILNEDELHNVLRKYQDILPSYITFEKMPHLNIGNTDRKKQVEQLQKELGDVSSMDLARAFYKRYGIKQNSFMANWKKYLKQ